MPALLRIDSNLASFRAAAEAEPNLSILGLIELSLRALCSFRVEGVLWPDDLRLFGGGVSPSIPFLQIGQVLCSLNHALAQLSWNQ